MGLEQHQAPLDLLERVAVPEEALGKTLAALRERTNLAEVVVVSTCLRTELYAVVERFHDGVADLQEFLAAQAGTTVEAIADHLTVQFDDAVAVHLFEVAAGIRSAVLGESEVLGQVRRAAERAEEERASGPVLQGLFRRAVQTGRQVRTQTAIARGSTSLSHIAVELATERLGGSLDGRQVVVVGAGAMGAGVVEALAPTGARVVVANRTTSRAAVLAARVDGRGVALAGLPAALTEAEVVIVTTGASLPVLDTDLVGDALDARTRTRPLVIVDLGVPRNVAPDLSQREDVVVLDMDDLRELADRAMAGRRSEVARAEEIVRQEVDRYRTESRARGAAPIVSSLRGRLEELRGAELQRHRSRSDLSEAQWEEVEATTRDVLAKLLHQPSLALKETAGTPRGERLVEALRVLFDL